MLTHFNKDGKAIMVDVTEKNETKRVAIASGKIIMNSETYKKVKEGKVGKGDVLGVARVAAIMASKKTSELIPMCHPLFLTGIEVKFRCLDEELSIEVKVTAKTEGKTGVEMEALTGATTALLTIYDMCKAMDKKMIINEIKLNKKTGGKSGEFVNE
ncbi:MULTISPECIES: cyclic pyranopterin monophosphate synthase MoaC [Cetobacterium]|jgi:cyclic pyranopterin phosphate synthase|uniref:Cyclic pyranopterin monophosphate synthase n=1 Tax=Candidatus Cetobacterium colombiensis TaxID=3073100 RepID=A0ABU4WCX8_9FUSO|nr:cyclic pyranopterin monophosphate synthase MoaC [Candidatus Cetobacterium colombiensis]MDX8337376.1 cyclic pyranopterin monophosphate synthase MoaC [Candidatus Cetobacterium colombiensis]